MSPSSLSPGLIGARVGDLLVPALEAYAARVAFIEGEREVTYAQLSARIAQALNRFGDLGLEPGDTIAQLSGNAVDLYAVMAAAYVGGFRSLTLHPLGGREDQAFILADSGARLFIADADYAERGAELAAGLPAGVGAFLHGADGPLPDFWSEATGRLSAAAVRGAAEDIVRLAYTGGTTGRPKGVMLSNRSLVTNTLLALAGLDWPSEVRFLCPAPISHGAGSIILPTLLRGGTVILQRGFHADSFLAALGRHRATVTWLVPTMIYALLDHPHAREADLTSLALLIYSGSPMAPARIAEALEVFGPVLAQCYGQTEAPNTVLTLSPAEHRSAEPRRLASAGRPFPGVRVSIRSEDDAEVPAGEIGEICVRGPLVMSGYWNQPEATAEAFRGDWLHTGDLGFRDPDGFVHLVDRRKDLIISGGFNVYPKEIEDVLLGHPAVAQAAVFGAPDPKWGEAVRAVVVLRTGQSVEPEQLIRRVREAKGPIQAPKVIEIVEEIPLTGLGKPDKKAIRARHWSVADRQIS